MPGKTTTTTFYSATVGTTAAVVVTNAQLVAQLNAAPEAGLSFMALTNSGASGNIWYTRANGTSSTMSVVTPTVGGLGCYELVPGQTVQFFGDGASVIPLNTIAAVGSAAGCAFTVEVG